MMNFIPIFPLNIVAYPTEVVSLHIFEPRYIQLITECFTENKNFGIPIVMENSLKEVGTLMQITSIEKKHNNGSMDIRTLGLKTFKLLEYVKNIPDKLYSGGVVTYTDIIDNGKTYKQEEVIKGLMHFHKLLEVEKIYKKPLEKLNSYDIAHHVGLTLLQEYEILTLPHESQRMLYLYKHLKQVTADIEERDNIIERIKLNGHFRNLSLKDFDF